MSKAAQAAPHLIQQDLRWPENGCNFLYPRPCCLAPCPAACRCCLPLPPPPQVSHARASPLWLPPNSESRDAQIGAAAATARRPYGPTGCSRAGQLGPGATPSLLHPHNRHPMVHVAGRRARPGWRLHSRSTQQVHAAPPQLIQPDFVAYTAPESTHSATSPILCRSRAHPSTSRSTPAPTQQHADRSRWPEGPVQGPPAAGGWPPAAARAGLQGERLQGPAAAPWGLWPSATRPPVRHPCPCAALRLPAHLCAACTPNWAARGAGQRRRHRRPLARRRRRPPHPLRRAPRPPRPSPGAPPEPQVTFIRDGKERTCEVGPNDYMLDAADANRIEVGARRERVPGYERCRCNPGSGAGCRPVGLVVSVLQPATAPAAAAAAVAAARLRLHVLRPPLTAPPPRCAPPTLAAECQLPRRRVRHLRQQAGQRHRGQRVAGGAG